MSLALAALSSCLVPSNGSGFSRKCVIVVPLNLKIVAQEGDLSAKRRVCPQAEKALSSASAPNVKRGWSRSAVEVNKSLLPLPSSFISHYGDTEPRKGADIIIESLEREGIEHVFAYPGGASMEIHQGEIFAAEGYARSTGKVGVCIATSGPGATNLHLEGRVPF